MNAIRCIRKGCLLYGLARSETAGAYSFAMILVHVLVVIRRINSEVKAAYCELRNRVKYSRVEPQNNQERIEASWTLIANYIDRRPHYGRY